MASRQPARRPACRASLACARLLPALLVLASVASAAADAPAGAAPRPALFSADGYRIARYRGPTPDAPPAGRRIDTAGLWALLAEADAPVLVDVQAAMFRPETIELGAAWLPAGPRLELPGSVWLPNVGEGRLAPVLERYLADNLARLTAGDPERALVFYCVVDCWMSWNAVKRAAALGYRNLYWYAEGSDGWAAAGLPLVPGEPVPLDPDLRTDPGTDPGNEPGPESGPPRPAGAPTAITRERDSL
jgi:PQQ-dependent catabolism-associated CXXCW motif protein